MIVERIADMELHNTSFWVL